MKNITKVKKTALTGFVNEIGGPKTFDRCVETSNTVDLIYFQKIKNNPMAILTIVKFSNNETNGYKCIICRDGEDRDFSEKFNAYLVSSANDVQ